MATNTNVASEASSTIAGTLLDWVRFILSLPVIHRLATLFRGSIASLAYDGKFKFGSWGNFTGESVTMVRLVERIANKGHILCLGCGAANILNDLPYQSFSSFTGVDLAAEGLRKARDKHNAPGISFLQGDMLTFKPEPGKYYSVILFLESMYYLPVRQAVELLERLLPHLTTNGEIVVTIAQPARFSKLVCAIRTRFRTQTRLEKKRLVIQITQ